jgi:hypothetical protein
MMIATALLVSASCQAGAVEFSSVYTDLQRDCRAAFDARDDAQGDDVPQKCTGVDGYAVAVGYSACAVHVSISKGSFDLEFPSQSSNVETRKLEWRLADGKPFAVILRLDEYDAGRDICEQKTKKTIEALTIKGLQGFTHIDHKLQVGKTPNINVEARQLADHGFVSGRSR